MSTIIKTETLQVDLEEHVAHVALIRPELLNRFDTPLHHDVVTTFETLAEHPDVRAILLTSTGRAFTAGGDAHRMQEVNANPEAAREEGEYGRRLMYALLALRSPLISAVQGPAMGIGANIAFLSDAVVAVRGAVFADPHVRMGLVAGDGGVLAWPATVGMARAKRHLLTGDPITAEDAYALGAVTDLVDDVEELLPTARALAARIAALPPLAVQGTKRALNRLLQQRAGEVFDLSLELEIASMTTRDMLEATTAFLEKRAGRYEGR